MQSKQKVESFPPVNIATYLRSRAMDAPFQRAVVMPMGEGPDGRVAYIHDTFSSLETRTNRLAFGLDAAGISRGTRVVLMVPPSLDFFALVFALFKVGAVIVMIDPGIGRGPLLKCLKEVEPEAFIGVPKAHVARLLFPGSFKKVRSLVTVGRRLFWGGHTLKSIEEMGCTDAYKPIVPEVGEMAAILFTSGSTGLPKGVVYTHEIFAAQIRMLREIYGMTPGEVDLCTFPLFALFSPALGMTAVVPDMDASRPAEADPEKLLQAMFDQGATQLFGSPALVDNLSRYCVDNGIALPSLKRVVSAGAPVRSDILNRMATLLPNGVQMFTPYGATESLPITNIGSDEIGQDTAQKTDKGAGVCVGRPVDGMTVEIIQIDDEAIAQFDPSLLTARGEIGEITVKGPVVTHAYFRRPESTALAKMADGSDVIHRMGDLGWFDGDGRLWMCGRKSHRVETANGLLFTIPCEAPFNSLPGVKRTALVGVGERPNQQPVVVVEVDGDKPEAEVLKELVAQSQRFEHTRQLKTFLFYKGSLPVDIRHNAKINRGILAEWAKSRVQVGAAS